MNGLAVPEILTKAEFAKLVQRDAAFVSRAISSGRICGDGLVGEGRGARIRVVVALEQLGRSLDLSQQMAQAAPILPEISGGALPLDAPEAPSAIHGLREESIELKNKKYRLDLEKAERQQLRESGELVLAADVAATLRKQIGPLVATFDELPAVIAKAVSEAHSLPYPETLITVKGAIRTQRAAWAARARQMGAEVPA